MGNDFSSTAHRSIPENLNFSFVKGSKKELKGESKGFVQVSGTAKLGGQTYMVSILVPKDQLKKLENEGRLESKLAETALKTCEALVLAEAKFGDVSEFKLSQNTVSLKGHELSLKELANTNKNELPYLQNAKIVDACAKHLLSQFAGSARNGASSPLSTPVPNASHDIPNASPSPVNTPSSRASDLPTRPSSERNSVSNDNLSSAASNTRDNSTIKTPGNIGVDNNASLINRNNSTTATTTSTKNYPTGELMELTHKILNLGNGDYSDQSSDQNAKDKLKKEINDYKVSLDSPKFTAEGAPKDALGALKDRLDDILLKLETPKPEGQKKETLTARKESTWVKGAVTPTMVQMQLQKKLEEISNRLKVVEPKLKTVMSNDVNTIKTFISFEKEMVKTDITGNQVASLSRQVSILEELAKLMESGSNEDFSNVEKSSDETRPAWVNGTIPKTPRLSESNAPPVSEGPETKTDTGQSKTSDTTTTDRKNKRHAKSMDDLVKSEEMVRNQTAPKISQRKVSEADRVTINSTSVSNSGDVTLERLLMTMRDIRLICETFNGLIRNKKGANDYKSNLLYSNFIDDKNRENIKEILQRLETIVNDKEVKKTDEFNAFYKTVKDIESTLKGVKGQNNRARKTDIQEINVQKIMNEMTRANISTV